MIDYFFNFKYNDILASWLYWIPAIFCLTFYTVKCVAEFHEDRAKSGERYYSAKLRVGTILGRIIASIAPGFNIIAASFDLAPTVFSKFFDYMQKTFDIPLVKGTYNADSK